MLIRITMRAATSIEISGQMQPANIRRLHLLRTRGVRVEVVVEGDAIRVFTNSAGHVVWARPTYLIDAMIFKADDQNFTDSIDRYRAQDIAVLNELDGTTGRFKYLLLKDSVNGRNNTGNNAR